MIERAIWTFLFETANGSRRFDDAFKNLLADLRTINLDHVSPQEALWFSNECRTPSRHHRWSLTFAMILDPVLLPQHPSPNPDTGANKGCSRMPPGSSPEMVTQVGSKAHDAAVHSIGDDPITTPSSTTLSSTGVPEPRRSSREKSSKNPVQPTPEPTTNTKKAKSKKRKHSSSAQATSSGAPASSVAYVIDLTQDLASVHKLVHHHQTVMYSDGLIRFPG